MYSQSDLEQLVAAMRRFGVRELDVEDGVSGRLTLALPLVQAAASVQPVPHQPAVVTSVLSPAMGQFKPCGLDDGLAPLCAGDAVQDGQVLGYVAMGAALLPIQASAAGVLGATLPEDGQVIGYGDVVFEIETSAQEA